MTDHTCITCPTPFYVTESDRAFYAKMDVPEPSNCPYCRMQRRLAVRNELSLYLRKCDKSGETIIAVHPEGSEYKIWAGEIWWSDKRDQLAEGRDFDFAKPFFEQFAGLERDVPQFALFQDGTSENCEYTNHGAENKNCYMSAVAWSEDCYYCQTLFQCVSCVENAMCRKCELCFQCVDCTQCYNLLFADDCVQCNDSYFLQDCRNCQKCFGGVGLRSKKFVWFGEQLDEEEWGKRLSEFKNAMTWEKIDEYKKRLYETSLKVPRKFYHGFGNENSIGDYLSNCKNVYFGFDCLELEDSAYCRLAGFNAHDLYDCDAGGAKSELVYEAGGILGAVNCIGIYFGRYLNDCYYSKCCFNSKNLFGCIGLVRKEYCIFNKQYTQEEYEKLVPRIIAHMKNEGSWGEFFPIKYSPFPYNCSNAMFEFPMTQNDVKGHGWAWRDGGPGDHSSAEKKFNITPQEKRFYERMGLPMPRYHFEKRFADLFARRNRHRVYLRKCDRCDVEIRTSYSIDRPEIIYCEKCYLEAVT